MDKLVAIEDGISNKRIITHVCYRVHTGVMIYTTQAIEHTEGVCMLLGIRLPTCERSLTWASDKTSTDIFSLNQGEKGSIFYNLVWHLFIVTLSWPLKLSGHIHRGASAGMFPDIWDHKSFPWFRTGMGLNPSWPATFISSYLRLISASWIAAVQLSLLGHAAYTSVHDGVSRYK